MSGVNADSAAIAGQTLLGAHPMVVAQCTFVLSGLVQGIGGFGGSLVAMALLPLVWPVRTAVGVSAVFGIILTSALAVRLRGHIQWREVGPVIGAALIGVPVGVYFLHAVPESWVVGALGGILLLHGSWSLLSAGGSRHVGAWVAPIAGFAGGALSGAFSVAGPPILVYATSRGWDRDTFRASLQAIFLATSALSLVGFVATDVVTWDTAQTNVALLPALLVGGWLGNAVSHRVPPDKFRVGVLVALLLMGGNYLMRALT